MTGWLLILALTSEPNPALRRMEVEQPSYRACTDEAKYWCGLYGDTDVAKCIRLSQSLPLKGKMGK